LPCFISQLVTVCPYIAQYSTPTLADARLTLCFTKRSAPELLLGAKHYGPEIDVWAVGAIFGELITLTPLFRGIEEPGQNPRDMYDRSQIEKIFLVNGVPKRANPRKESHQSEDSSELFGADDLLWPTCEAHPFWTRAKEAGLMDTKPTGYPKLIAENGAELNLLKALCRYDPEKRLTATNALAHPYFASSPKPLRNALDPGDAPPEVYPQRKIKKDPDRGEKRQMAEREPGEVAPRGAAGNAALNAVRSYGDLRKH
jgi:cyclin-dependent kinase 8/11